MSAPLPLTAVRALALHAQGLAAAASPDPTPDALYAAVERLGCVQIDTLHMVRRSHYVTLWSRLGRYDPAAFDRLIYDPTQRRLFEYWGHAASILPLTGYRFRQPEMDRLRATGGWWGGWGKKPENQPVIEAVRRRLTEEGALRASDFDRDGHQPGSWWSWKPAKRALEHLYNTGDVMIADRVNFQRVYDLRERVLPDWVDTRPVTADEANRHHIEHAARALGIFEAGHASDYAYLRRGTGMPHVKALLAEGVLVEVQAEVMGGAVRPLLVHRESLHALAQAADGAITAERTTFLNPFDPLFWANGRDELLWGFRQRLEAYKPAKDRIWGYYCLPIVHRGRLIGRFDPRLERKARTLRLVSLLLEPGIAPDEEMIADVAAAMRDFLAWHEADTLVIERSDPPDFGDRLMAAM